MKSYFEAIRLTVSKHKFDKVGANIFNMDETGIVLNHKPMKLEARSGTKSVRSRSNGNKDIITVIAAVNADGGRTPPHMVPKCFIRLFVRCYAYGHPD